MSDFVCLRTFPLFINALLIPEINDPLKFFLHFNHSTCFGHKEHDILVTHCHFLHISAIHYLDPKI